MLLRVGEIGRLKSARSRGAGAPAWTPAQLPDLKLWLHPSSGFSQSDRLDQWNDASGLGNHVSSTGTNRPIVTAAAINGLDAVTFNRTNNEFLAQDSLAALFNGSDVPYSFAAVARFSSTASHRTLFSVGATTGSSPFIRTYMLAGTPSATHHQRRGNDAVNNEPVGNAAHNTSWRIHQTIFPGTTVTHKIDGVADINAAAADAGSMSGLNRFTIGSSRRQATLFDSLGGDYAEAILSMSAWSTDDETRVLNYLKSKYGL